MEPNIENQNSESVSRSPVSASENKDKFLPISILVAAIVIAGAVMFASFYKGGGGATAPAAGQGSNPAAAAQTATTSAASIMALGPRDAILGNANAPVTIVEYGDYQCPYCTRFFSQTEPEIVQNYVDTGKVKMVFRDFAFLGPESTAAANAAQCAEDQNKLWPYHDALYTAKVADEAKGGAEDDGFYTNAEFLKLAQQVGLDIPTFTSCIQQSKDASIVASEMSAAQAAGVNSTPTFFVNGQEIQGAEPYSTFSATIDALLK